MSKIYGISAGYFVVQSAVIFVLVTDLNFRHLSCYDTIIEYLQSYVSANECLSSFCRLYWSVMLLNVLCLYNHDIVAYYNSSRAYLHPADIASNNAVKVLSTRNLVC